MKYAVIAAGEGSRLAAEGIDVPKPLVKVGGEHLIDRLIRVFIENEAEEIVVICNDITAQVSLHLVKLQADGLQGQPVPLRFVVKSTPSSMHSFYEISRYLGDGLSASQRWIPYSVRMSSKTISLCSASHWRAARPTE